MRRVENCLFINVIFQYTKEYHNLFMEAGVPPKRKLTRFFVTPDAAVQPGKSLCFKILQVQFKLYLMKFNLKVFKKVCLILFIIMQRM
jgi:hypothetical protein